MNKLVSNNQTKTENNIVLSEIQVIDLQLLQLKVEFEFLKEELIKKGKVNSCFLKKKSFLLDQFAIHKFAKTRIKIRESIPNLTRNELLICSYLKYDFTSKDIATSTGKSIHSIEVARTRLRKKLGINNTRISIQNYVCKQLKNEVI